MKLKQIGAINLETRLDAGIRQTEPLLEDVNYKNNVVTIEPATNTYKHKWILVGRDIYTRTITQIYCATDDIRRLRREVERYFDLKRFRPKIIN